MTLRLKFATPRCKQTGYLREFFALRATSSVSVPRADSSPNILRNLPCKFLGCFAGLVCSYKIFSFFDAESFGVFIFTRNKNYAPANQGIGIASKA